jgi:hypothetical protein
VNFNINKNTIIQADRIGGQTLVGVWGKEFPLPHGNCFDVVVNEEKGYKIVNMVLENLQHLIDQQIIAWPIDILAISEHQAIMIDKRIPKEYYAKRICSICCPFALLPITQQVEAWHDQLTGKCVVHDEGEFTYVSYPVNFPGGKISP